jgi:hypothetical protein
MDLRKQLNLQVSIGGGGTMTVPFLIVSLFRFVTALKTAAKDFLPVLP